MERRVGGPGLARCALPYGSAMLRSSRRPAYGHAAPGRPSLRHRSSPRCGLCSRTSECWPPFRWIAKIISPPFAIDDDLDDQLAYESLTRSRTRVRGAISKAMQANCYPTKARQHFCEWLWPAGDVCAGVTLLAGDTPAPLLWSDLALKAKLATDPSTLCNMKWLPDAQGKHRFRGGYPADGRKLRQDSCLSCWCEARMGT